MKHHELTLEEVARVANGLGVEGFKSLSSSLPPVDAKHGARPLGQVEAFLNMLNPADLDRLLAGEASIEIVELIRKLVDKNGRMIPLAGMKSAVCDPNTSFKLVQPTINYAERINRLIRFFPGRTFVSAEEFQKRSKALVEQLRQNPILSNLFNGVCLPVCYPQFKLGDYGEDLENVFLNAVGNSYKSHFPEREFYNHREGELKGKVSIVEENHKQLIAKMAEGPVVGIQFFPLQGFSINADRELMALLPKSLALSGPIDLATAITVYPDVLARDFNTPGYDCAAVSWGSADYSLFFWANDDKLRFDFTDDLRLADDAGSAGLVFLG